LPLTLLRLNSEHQLAVIELGMNHPGETKVLADIASPDITLINNAQREHQEFMQTVEAVAKEHALAIQALPVDGYAVFPSDSEYADIWYRAAQTRPIYTFALNDERIQNQSDRPADVIGRWHENGQLEINSPHWSSRAIVQLKTLGDHNAKNALAATAVGLAAGVSKEAIIQGLEAFEAVGGRMRKLEIKIGKTSITLVDDTYNANPDSVIAAIQAIEDLPGEHWLVLGDMGEVGNQGPAFHSEVGEYAAHHQIDQLLSIGELTTFTAEAFAKYKSSVHKNSNKLSQHFSSMEQLTSQLTTQIKIFVEELEIKSGTTELSAAAPSLVILVKGSRFTKMERVIQHLLSLEDPCYSS
jgi:UDP-N-acetylmuramoyl-tripeptide--D-alanyl-D-alanine ligase